MMTKAASAVRVERGPVRNAPPTLEWVAVGDLNVDPAYQREVDGAKSRVIVAGMVKAWDWALCQPLVVARRAEEGLFVLDGQHRLRGAAERGDIPHLPCVILSRVGIAEEAATFVALNTRRQRLSQADIFTGMLAAGDAEAKRIAELLAETGWRQVKSSNTQAWKPGDLHCAPMLVKMMASHGDEALRNALAALGEAYADRAVTCSGTLLRALANIYRDGDLTGEDPDTFIAALGMVEPQDWDEFRRDVQREYPMLSRVEALAKAMMDAYRAEVREMAA